MKRILSFLLILFCLVACKKAAPEENVTRVVHPEWTKNAVIYQVNVRQFSPEGTFAAIEPQLDRLSELGVDILWLMPVHPIGVEGRKGTLGSYYAVKDYCSVNPEFGTLEDFDHFLAVAHEKGFKVILDWVANHTGRDHAWTREHRNWYHLDADGNLATQYDWTDIAHLDYVNHPEVYDAMEKQMQFWIDRGVDGFRCDVASEVPTDFWEKTFADFRAQRPDDFFFLAENNVPTATVSGDASKMTAVTFLTANVPYDSAFITADATEKDQPALEELAEKANPNGGENSPTSNKGSGGCDAGLGVAGLAALLPALTKKRK